ncbi:hypothetical protein QQ020_16905 [Fulvivirgaceae bacterium BMA12]|uniref:Uncharacterized protein n=1 Tax=Agaribacillus aureus TaxID=3051825 RepID=A0ABT8LAD5_9BACT|nr:hypothetical protein [Fulvivirgaceae bacterium BMA12]
MGLASTPGRLVDLIIGISRSLQLPAGLLLESYQKPFTFLASQRKIFGNQQFPLLVPALWADF